MRLREHTEGLTVFHCFSSPRPSCRSQFLSSSHSFVSSLGVTTCFPCGTLALFTQERILVSSLPFWLLLSRLCQLRREQASRERALRMGEMRCLFLCHIFFSPPIWAIACMQQNPCSHRHTPQLSNSPFLPKII